MIHDLELEDPSAPPEYDVVIVGSGPAGTTLACELAGCGAKIAVLESGRRKPTPHGDALKRVVSDAIAIKDYSRERVLGGASTTWAGLSAPLDAVDFEDRALAMPGWPIARDELLPWYAEAERYRFPPLHHFEVEAARTTSRSGLAALRSKGGIVPSWERIAEKAFLAAAEPQDFGREHRAVYERHDVDLWLDATVLEIAGGGERATHVLARSRRGRPLELRARVFVIATGGIENARLLLLSRGFSSLSSSGPSGGPSGLGNAHDQVGRGFMNHPKNYCGVITLARPVEKLPYYFGCLFDGFAGYAGLRLRDEEQRARGLMNSYVRLEPLFPWSDSRGVEALVLIAKKSRFALARLKARAKAGGEVVELRDYSETGDDSELQNERKSLLDWIGLLLGIVVDLPRVVRYLWFRLVARAKPKVRRVRLRNFMEMEPDAENRVTLAGGASDVDAYGRPLPRVRHRVTERDRRSLIALHEALAAEIARQGIGRLDSDLATADPWPIDQDASHHLGSTRMGDDPRTSVVDRDCRVHGVLNVYLAGGSVFPTSGCANPTFTIVALAIRLAAHLKRDVLGSPREGA